MLSVASNAGPDDTRIFGPSSSLIVGPISFSLKLVVSDFYIILD
jgi:hypothetical protein